MKIISWNVAHRSQCWKRLLEMDADVALLQEAAEPDVGAALEARNIGGLGVYFVKTLMDHVEYRRENDRNRLTLTKRNTP